ncbi:zinc finger protein 493 isoform X2 [Bicyclus anynana]|uniref:Zinc finger protein 493 isoform X2 n=1 Tax=Bicyclus anynana TaxID=110368 RepID=A0A6J1NQW7_BICAN|nr:zinc finger protein 493 isoform X2 [Bicyclus anynana]
MAFSNTKNCVKMVPTLTQNSCRMCLDTKYSDVINLSECTHILDLLKYCVGFTMNLQYTSQVLCMKCKNKVEEFAEFKKKCAETEIIWRKYPILSNNHPQKEELNCSIDVQVKAIKNELSDTEQVCDDNEICTEVDLNSFEPKSGIEINNSSQSPKLPKFLNDTKESNHCNVKSENTTKTYKCKKYNHKWLQKHRKRCTNYLKKTDQTRVKTENGNGKSCTDKCGLCDAIFTCDLNEHIKQHWLDNHLQCDLCNYCGIDFAHMITHRYNHYPNMKLRCIECDKRKSSILSLQFHFRSVHLQKPGGYCTLCDKTFDKFKTWKTHHRKHTESNRMYVCDHCDRKFLYRYEIKAHLVNHSDLRQYVCETCGKGFRRMFTLQDHIRNMHIEREPVKCGHCNKIYKSKYNLKIHLRNVTVEKQFICEVCSKKFYTERILTKHMFWHSNERPFGCEVCGLKYKAKAQLKVHMVKHSGAMPFTCVNCGKGFASTSQLKRHKSVHTGVRAYKCLHCERSFHAKKRLLEHAAQHKNDGGVKLEK